MASAVIGRVACPECDFNAAHVKESEKTVYRYCPSCGATYHAGKRGTPRGDALLAKMRPEGGAKPAPKVEAAPAVVDATPAPVTQAPAAPKRAGLFF